MEADGDSIVIPDLDIPEDFVWVWRTWIRLNDNRSWLGGGMGAAVPAPISFSAILEWAGYYEYDEDMVRTLEVCIKEMDNVFITHTIEKAKLDGKAKR